MFQSRFQVQSIAAFTLATCLVGCASNSTPAPVVPAPPSPAVAPQPPAAATATNPSPPPAVPQMPIVPGAAPAPNAVAQPGQPGNQEWTVFELPNEGFSISLPPGWIQLSQSPEQFEAMLKNVERQNPQLGVAMRAARAAAVNMKFRGIELASLATGFAPNIGVITEKLPIALTVQQYAEVATAQLQRLPNAKVSGHTTFKTDHGDAERLTSSLVVTTPTGQSISATITQYIFVKDQTAYVITAGAPENQSSKYAETFDKLAQTFRITQ